MKPWLNPCALTPARRAAHAIPKFRTTVAIFRRLRRAAPHLSRPLPPGILASVDWKPPLRRDGRQFAARVTDLEQILRVESRDSVRRDPCRPNSPRPSDLAAHPGKENAMNALLVFLLVIGAGAVYSLGLAAFVTYVPRWLEHLSSSLWQR